MTSKSGLLLHTLFSIFCEMFLHMCIRYFLPCIFLFALSIQQGAGQVSSTDTTKTETLPSQAVADSFYTPRIPIPLVGSIDRLLSAQHLLTDSLINLQDYLYLGDLLWMVPGTFLRNFGSPGQWQQISIEGVEARSIQFMSDGIPLNDAYTGLFNLSLYPTENIERIEYITGTRAFLYGLNSTGGAINFVTKNKKAIHPYSRIRYSESGYGYGFIDGMVSQDIIRGLNLTTGAFHNTFGGRFDNSKYDQWNARAKLRYNISNNINFFVSELYNSTNLGLWGGVDNSTLPGNRFDRIQATIQNTDAFEKITRHDVQAGIATRYSADSSAISSLTFFYSTQLREYRDPQNFFNTNDIVLEQNQVSRWYGARLQHEQSIGTQRLEIGGELVTRRVLIAPATNAYQESQYSAFGKFELGLSKYFRLTPLARFDNYMGTRISFGADVIILPTECTNIFGGISRSYRIFSFQENSKFGMFHDVYVTQFIPEEHLLFEVGFRWKTAEHLSMELKGINRHVKNPITASPDYYSPNDPDYYSFQNTPVVTYRGLVMSTTIQAGSFVLEGEAQYLDQVNDGVSMLTLPRWSATGGLYFWDTLVSGHLNLKIGIRGRAYSSYIGREFNTLQLSYEPPGQGAAIDAAGLVDFFLIARLGSAYIHVIMENLLDRKYIMNNFYPMLDRSLRFGVSWEFTN